MAKWNTGTPWSLSVDGMRRFNRFKSQYPEAILKSPNGKTVKVKDFQDYFEVRKALGVSRGTNPSKSKILIDVGEGFVDLGELESNVRASGTNAIAMEVFVACATLMPINSYADFLKYVNTDEGSLYERMKGVSRKDIDNILNVVEDNHSYADDFIKVAKKIHSIAHMKDPSRYTLLAPSEWNAIKVIGAKVLTAALGVDIKKDKWNPADIVFVRDDFKLEELKKFNAGSDILELNGAFDTMMRKGIVVPISIKKDANAIRGSRGISNEMKPEFDSINIKKEVIDTNGILTTSKGEKIRVKLNYSSGVPDDNVVQRRVLGWIKANGVDHVEKTAAIAMGSIEMSSSWHVVNGETVSTHTADNKYRPTVDHIILSMSSRAVWIKFKEEFIIARFKGGSSLQLSVENERGLDTITDVKDVDIEGLNPKQAKFLMLESLLNS